MEKVFKPLAKFQRFIMSMKKYFRFPFKMFFIGWRLLMYTRTLINNPTLASKRPFKGRPEVRNRKVSSFFMWKEVFLAALCFRVGGTEKKKTKIESRKWLFKTRGVFLYGERKRNQEATSGENTLGSS